MGDVGRALDRDDDVLRAGKSPWAAFLRSIEADLETLGEDGIGPKSSVAALSSCSVGGTAQLREFQSKEEGLLQLKEFHRKRSCSVETVGLLLAQPGGWHPLRFSFQQVDLVEKLLVGTVRVAAKIYLSSNDHRFNDDTVICQTSLRVSSRQLIPIVFFRSNLLRCFQEFQKRIQ